jgi:hypothetical protein
MTKKQEQVLQLYVERMQELKKYDNEVAHCRADDLLLEVLRELGFGALADAFDQLVEDVDGFWYA